MPPSKPVSSRRRFLQSTLTAGAAASIYPALSAGREIASPPRSSAPDVKSFDLEEITLTDLQEGMKSGKFTARSLVERYTARIEEIDKRGPAVNAIIEMNPDAPAIADALDQERKAK